MIDGFEWGARRAFAPFAIHPTHVALCSGSGFGSEGESTSSVCIAWPYAARGLSAIRTAPIPQPAQGPARTGHNRRSQQPGQRGLAKPIEAYDLTERLIAEKRRARRDVPWIGFNTPPDESSSYQGACGVRPADSFLRTGEDRCRYGAARWRDALRRLGARPLGAADRPDLHEPVDFPGAVAQARQHLSRVRPHPGGRARAAEGLVVEHERPAPCAGGLPDQG